MLDSLIQALSVLKPWLGDSLFLFTLAIGVLFAIAVFSALYVLSRTGSPARRRLLEGAGQFGTPADSRARKIERAVAPAKALFIPTKASELGRSRQRLLHAGYRGDEALTVFYLAKTLATIAFGVGAAVFAFAVLEGDSRSILLWMLGGACLGMILPSYLLDKRVVARQTEIVNAFPDVLDLMVACTEAGLGLNASIQRVARETSTIYPALSAELEKVNSDIRAGADRVQALREMSTRTGVEEISGFVSMISQSIRFGTSVADTLRIYAEEFRDKRMQRAEEMAAKVSTKLIFPLVLCIFPAFFAVAIGPAVIAIVRGLGQLSPGS